jgi:transcriptional regulator with PAS, ATPase and Fis domain
MSNIIGKSNKIQIVFDLAQRSAQQGSTTIIYGETGTGKELVAEAIHSLSDRRDGPFVPVNCAAIPGELFEREFFGHVKGAFTGAHSDKPGLLKTAHLGTLFLDEVGELDLGAQSKLLRALDGGEYTPIGSQKRETSDFQLVAATNRDLEAMARKGTFRQDLFYRIHIIPIVLPPLRERKEDIPFLVEHFLSHFDTARRMPSKDIAKLLLYDWPGNVRELQNVVERYVAMGNLDFLGLEEIDTPTGLDHSLSDVSLREALDRYEQQLIAATLDKYSGNRTQTASVLGLPRKTLFRKMKKHHIG